MLAHGLALSLNEPLGCVQSRKKLAKLAFLVLGLVEWFTLAPPYRVMKIVKRLQHLHIEKIF